MSDAKVLKLCREHSEWISALQKASQIIFNCDNLPEQLLPKTELIGMAYLLDNYRKSARDKASILEWTLYDMTEHLAILCENAKKQSILPNVSLEV